MTYEQEKNTLTDLLEEVAELIESVESAIESNAVLLENIAQLKS